MTVIRTADKNDLAALERELKLALEEHVSASREESVARGAVTEATNRVNKAQKALTAYVDNLKKQAPWNTDWHSEKNRGQSV
jgi:hypothetical protein